MSKMIVMKFGGSSLSSAGAIRGVTEIVKSQIAAEPVVVVSAIGDTTDRLLEAAREAERGHCYLAWHGLKNLWEEHSEIAGAVTEGEQWRQVEDSLHKSFNELNRLFVKLEDDGCELTEALKDEVASFGERMSSEMIAAALHCAGVATVHLDSRQLILTDAQFTHAEPLYWETYAKLRRVVPRLGTWRTVVMGGFIGSTELGQTTTLGRGGSDLTASIVGAAINAEEIQMWKDVDGVLTCNPRLYGAPCSIASLSYDEASKLALAGAEILHPHTMAPAARQRIPIVVRNSRRPDAPGTRIDAMAEGCPDGFKSIAARQDLTVLEVRVENHGEDSMGELRQLCGRHGVSPLLLSQSGNVLFLGIKGSDRFETLKLDLTGCIEVRLHHGCAALTLVGAAGDALKLADRVRGVLKNAEFVLFDSNSAHSLTVVVRQPDVRKSLALLHNEFFAGADPRRLTEGKSETSTEASAANVRPQLVQTPIRRPRIILVNN